MRKKKEKRERGEMTNDCAYLIAINSMLQGGKSGDKRRKITRATTTSDGRGGRSNARSTSQSNRSGRRAEVRNRE